MKNRIMHSRDLLIRLALLGLAIGDVAHAELSSATAKLSAAHGTPRWIVETFFTQATFPDASSFYAGEMTHYLATPPMGAYMPPGYRIDIGIIEETPTRQVFRITYSHSPKAADWYAFMEKSENQWRLTAVRRLTLPPFVDVLFSKLKTQSDRTAKEEAEFRQMELMRASDDDLRANLRTHLLEYIALAESASRGETKETLAPTLERLRLTSVDCDKAGWVQFTIGGIGDNSVGYLYTPPGVSPPQMAPSDFILVEAVVPGWYLFKTT